MTLASVESTNPIDLSKSLLNGGTPTLFRWTSDKWIKLNTQVNKHVAGWKISFELFFPIKEKDSPKGRCVSYSIRRCLYFLFRLLCCFTNWRSISQLNLSRRRAQGSESNQCKFDRSGNVLKNSRESWGVLYLMVHTGIASVYYLCMSRHTFHKAKMLYRSNHSIASTRAT